MSNRFIKAFLAASFLAGAAVHPVTAGSANSPVQGPVAPEAPPTFELDKAGKRAHMDFKLTPKPISDANMKFSHFSNRKLMIFYFSAKCSHCQHAVAYVQKLADELTAQGFTAIAIGVKFNSEDDIRGFIRDYKVRMPMFHDADQGFGSNYGTGSIPLVFVVNGNGEYIRYKTFTAEQTPNQVKAEAARMASK